MKFYICIFVLLMPIMSFGQDLDSLEQVLKTEILTDAEKIKILDDLNWLYNSVDAGRSYVSANRDWIWPGKQRTKRWSAPS